MCGFETVDSLFFLQRESFVTGEDLMSSQEEKSMDYQEKAKWIVEVLTYQRKFAGRTELPVHGWEVDVSELDKQIDSLKKEIPELHSKADNGDEEAKNNFDKKSADLKKLEEKRSEEMREQAKKIAKQYDKLADAIKTIVKDGKYQLADEKLSSVPLPVVNGKDTALKLHARMIVESYREAKSVSRNGKWHESPVYAAFFAHSSLMSNSSRYIQNLENFIRDAEQNATEDDLYKCFLFDKKSTAIENVGARLQGVLEEYNLSIVKILNAHERLDILREQSEEFNNIASLFAAETKKFRDHKTEQVKDKQNKVESVPSAVAI